MKGGHGQAQIGFATPPNAQWKVVASPVWNAYDSQTVDSSQSLQRFIWQDIT